MEMWAGACGEDLLSQTSSALFTVRVSAIDVGPRAGMRPGALHDVAVGGGVLAGFGAAAQFGQDLAVVGEQGFGALRIRTHGEHRLLKVRVGRHGGGEQIGDRGIEIEIHAGLGGSDQMQHFKVQSGALLARRAGCEWSCVWKEIDFGLQEVAAVLTTIEKLLDLEAIDALGENVAAPVGIAVQHAHHLRGAADYGKSIALRTDHAEGSAGGDALCNHPAVTWLEDVKGQRHSGKEHELEREERNLHALQRSSCGVAGCELGTTRLCIRMALRRLRI